MKLLKHTLLYSCMAVMLPVYAISVPITNAQFDTKQLRDNATTYLITGWNTNTGLAGLYNPVHAVFSGEEGHGAHRNTLYMIDNASVSQTLHFRTLENTTFTLSFDVGQRADVGMQNYTVKVTAPFPKP